MRRRHREKERDFMDYLSIATYAAAFAVSAITFICGARRLLNKKTLAYFHFLIWGVACFVLLSLSACVNCLCAATYEPYVSLGSFGSAGVYIAFLSANLGVLDRIVDERTPSTRKARYLALIFPVIVEAVILWLCANYVSRGHIASGIMLLILSVPMVISCYLNIKHLLLPMDAMEILKATRGCDVTCLIFALVEFLYILTVAFGSVLFAEILFFLRSAMLVLLMIFAVRGAKKWLLSN